MARSRQEVLSFISRSEENTYKTAKGLLFDTFFRDHLFSKPILGIEQKVIFR